MAAKIRDLKGLDWVRIGIRNPRNWDESSKNVFLGQVFCELTVSGSHVPLYETYTLDYYPGVTTVGSVFL